jgi:3-oxoacyl-[acyl-carrier protein] reductase
MDLKGARALVTGGGEGIGRAIAERLIAKGARTGIMGRRADLLKTTADAIGALAVPGDVAVEADAVRAVQTLVDAYGGIDILVNNAGFGYFAPLTELDARRFEEVFATNVLGAMLMGREAAKRFVAQQSGNLINISSTSGLRGGARGTAYSGSKFALRGMTECWREELRRHNVRVTLVNPSEVQTAFFSKVGGRQEPSPKKLRGEEIAAAIVGFLEIDDRGFVPEFSVFATNPF